MKVPHALRVEVPAEELAEVLSALDAAGLRFGWLEWREPQPLPESLRQASEHGALRAVAVGEGLSVAVKARRGAPVACDLVREHFLGCAVVFVRGGDEGAATLQPAAPGRWEIRAAGRSARVLSPQELAGRLRSPRPLS